jgi:hypothetical protein
MTRYPIHRRSVPNSQSEFEFSLPGTNPYGPAMTDPFLQRLFPAEICAWLDDNSDILRRETSPAVTVERLHDLGAMPQQCEVIG